MYSKILLVPFLTLCIVGDFNESVHAFNSHEHSHESFATKKYSNTSALKFSSNLSPTYQIGSKNNKVNYLLNDYGEIGSLQLELFFDSSVISINDVYTNGFESFKDIAIGNSSVKITLLYSEQINELNLFNVDFNVVNGKNNEDTVFDLVINEAYSLDQKPISIQGCRNSIKLIENTTELNFINYYINSDKTDLQKGDTFTIDLRIENQKENLIKSGSYTINYDSSILEFVSYEKGAFLLEGNTLFEINADIPGIINYSYVTTENHYRNELIKFTFKNKINENSNSVLELVSNSLVDSYGNKVISNKTQLRFNTIYNKYSGQEDQSVLTELKIDEKLGNVKLIFSLPDNPFISAGDYKINFDNNKLKFNKGVKLAASEYFDFVNLNTKQSSSGNLILNLVHNNSKVFSGSFYELYFNFNNKCENINSIITINGTDIYDSELIKVPDYNKKISVITSTLSHTLSDWTIETPATCTTDGLKVQRCTVCNEIINREVINATGHAYGDWIIDKDATCVNNGSKHKICANCGDIVTETIPSLGGHKLGEWEIENPATCTTDGLKVQKCTVCGEIINQEVIKATGHKYGDWIIDKDSTCKEEGTHHKECSNCGDVIEEIIPKKDHSGKWVVTKEATCKDKGIKSFICESCNEVLETEEIPLLEHKTSWKVTKEATENEEGVESLICENCGEVIETRPIPKLPKKDNSTTGIIVVSSIIGGVILILSLVLTIFFVKKKKTKI